MQMVDGDATASRASFELAHPELLPPGRACLLTELPDRITAHIGAPHASLPLLEQLTTQHQVLLQQERWLQTGRWYSDRIDEPPQGRGIAEASWHLIPGADLPRGRLCLSVERRGSIAWLLHAEHATQQLCDEINAWLRRIVGDGLWRQAWPG